MGSRSSRRKWGENGAKGEAKSNFRLENRPWLDSRAFWVVSSRCGLRLVHICNHGVHGFLFLHVLVQKHMKTQLILTILNFHFFSYFGFPKISKTLLSHVCGENADERLFCFTSAAKMLADPLVRCCPWCEHRCVPCCAKHIVKPQWR